MSDRISAEERVFNLTLALCDAPIGLTKREIYERVQGYRREASTRSALDRLFERDKDLLREAGIPLRVDDDPSAPGDNQLMRYRIDAGALEVPEHFSLTGPELAVVGLAAALWANATAGEGSAQLLAKLRTLGFSGDPHGALPGISVDTTAYRALQAARDAGRWVQFSYAAPGYAAPAERTVWPLALVSADERWNLLGLRPDGEQRTYLLDRIVGDVCDASLAPAAPSIPRKNWDEYAADQLRQLEAQQVAVVQVRPGSETAARLLRRADGPARDGVIRFHYLDEELCAADLCEAGPEVTVLAPAALVDAVHRQRERLRKGHTGPVTEDVSVARPLEHTRSGTPRAKVPDRLGLLLALVPWALQHPGATVAEAAQAFSVPAERIRRSIRTITVSGIPGQTAAYLPGDLFDIDWEAFNTDDRIFLTNTVVLRRGQRLNRRDLGELLAGLHYARAVLPPEAHRTADRAAGKLSALVSETPTIPSPDGVTTADRVVGHSLGILAAAMQARAQVTFSYTNSSGVHSLRTATPISTRVVGDTWYLTGWNDDGPQPGSATRTFRLDRMSHLSMGATAPEHVPELRKAPAEKPLDLIVQVDTRARAFLSWYAPDGRVPQAGIYHIQVANLPATVRAVARWAGHVRILAPAVARDAVQAWAAAPPVMNPSVTEQPHTVG